MKMALPTRDARPRPPDEAAGERRRETGPVGPPQSVIGLAGGRPSLMPRGAPATGIGAATLRTDVTAANGGTAVLRRFELTGVRTLGGSIGIDRSSDNPRSPQVLAGAAPGMPRTSIAHPSAQAEEAPAHVGGASAVITSPQGTQGTQGVGIVESERSAVSVSETFRAQDATIPIREVTEEAGNADIRVIAATAPSPR